MRLIVTLALPLTKRFVSSPHSSSSFFLLLLAITSSPGARGSAHPVPFYLILHPSIPIRIHPVAASGSWGKSSFSYRPFLKRYLPRGMRSTSCWLPFLKGRHHRMLIKSRQSSPFGLPPPRPHSGTIAPLVRRQAGILPV